MKKLKLLLLLIVFVLLSSTQSLLFLGRDASLPASAHQVPQTPSNLSNPQASGVATWTNITTSVGPRPFRGNTQMVYDAADGYSVLLDEIGTTWKFSAGSWVQISPSSTHPAYRTYARMVYDAADGYVVYFGGLYLGWMNDTWKFHAGTWTNITGTAGLAPSGRSQYALGYDDADHYVLLFGGGCSAAFSGCLLSGGSFREFTDTWKFQSGTWTNITSTVGPAPSADNFAASIVYDPSDGYTILVGQGGTWKFTGGTWSKLAISGPIIGSDAGLIYDNKQGYVVVFGGCCSLSQTWKFSGGAWINVTSIVGTPPSPRLEFGMAYDGASGSVILFGGEFYDATHLTPVFFGDTWKLSVAVSGSTPFNCEWDASSGRFPDQACPPWQAVNTDTQYVPVLSNGNLTLHLSSAGHFMFYKQSGSNISFPAIGEIQARLKVDSDTSSVNYRSAAWIEFVVAPYTGNTLYFGQDKLFLLTGPSSVGQSVTVDTHLSFHTYTITVNSTGTIQVYQDDIPILTGSTYYNTSPTDNGPLPLIEWGEGGGAAFGVSEWQFVRHNAHATGCASICTPAPSGLIHWWRAEGNANDTVGGNSGTLVNGAGFQSGKVGQGFSFNGINQYVQTANPVPFGSNDFSIDFWTNLNSNPSITGFIADDNGIGCNNKWVLWLEFGKLNLHLNKAGSCVGTGGRFAQYPWTPNLHQWYNLAVTRNAGNITIYIDGVKVSSELTTFTTNPTAPLTIGQADTRFLDGSMDEVQIYDRALNTSEIQAIHNAGSAGVCPCVPAPTGLVSWWPLDGNANDIRGGNSGTVVGTGGQFVPAEVGQGFQSGGPGSVVRVNDTTSLNPAQFTIDAWAKINALTSSNMPIVWKGNAQGFDVTSSYSLGVFGNPGSLSFPPGSIISGTPAIGKAFFTINNGALDQVLVSSAPIAIGSFVHYAVSADGASIRLYINGTLNIEANQMMTPQHSQFPFQIASANGTSVLGLFWNGIIDEVHFFNRALSVTEIQSIFNAGSAGLCTCITAPASLVSWWPANGNANDVIGHHDGILENGAAFGPGEVGQAFSFNGVNQFVNVTNDPAWNFGSNPFSIDLWVKFNQPPGHAGFIGQDERPGNFNKWFFGLNPLPTDTGVLTFAINGPSLGPITTVSAHWTPNAGRWYHVAVTRETTGVYTLYIDGVNAATATNTTPIPNVAANLIIGAASWPLNGQIDEVQIFSRALSSSEVQAIHNAGSFGQCKPTPVTWSQLFPTSSPPSRYFTSMASDAADGYVLLFGGVNTTHVMGDTWMFKAGVWTQLSPSTSPPPRYGASMVYDAADGYVLLFGGAANGNFLSDTWEFKGGIWTQLFPASAPSSRYFVTTTYDVADGYVILFGGENSGGFLGDTWKFTAGTWAQLATPTSPSARCCVSMTYDAADRYVLLFGGDASSVFGDTWTFKAGAWSQLSPSSSPSIRAAAGMAYDQDQGYILLFGGENVTSATAPQRDTWEFTSGVWIQLSPTSSPSARDAFGLVYDSTDGYPLLFSGYNGTGVLGDTWKFGPITTVPTKATPTISSAVTPSSIMIGGSASDLATLTGGSGPTGTVTYTAYSDSACAVLVFTSPSIPLGTSSASFTPSTTGTYLWIASYSGDANNNAVATTCGAVGETLTVSMHPSTTATVVFDASTNAPWSGTETTPASAYDTATVTGVTRLIPSGTVTYTEYTTGTCSGSGVSAGTFTLTATGSVPNSFAIISPLAAGSFGFIATYSGDSNYGGSASACESFSVAKGISTTASVVYDASTNVAWSGTETSGSSAYDVSHEIVTGFTPTGTVTYTFYSTGTCSGSGVSAGTVTLSATGTPKSNTEGPLSAGSYSFIATYSGDSNYAGSNSGCEPFTVSKATPTVTTAVSPTTITIGGSAIDLATVSGGFSPTGAVTYTAYSDATCTTLVFTSSGIALGSTSAAFTPTALGTYHFVASYSGDVNNNPVSTACGAPGETLTVVPLPVPTLTTVIKDANGNLVTSIVAGALAHDTATITPTPPSTIVTGTVTYTAYSNGKCTGQPFVTPDQVTITTTGTIPDSAPGTAGAGTYSIQATYSGDSNNAPAASPCEVLTITKASPMLLTLLSSNSITTGNTVSDSATLTGGFQAGGTVTYSVFNNNVCTAPGKIVSTVQVSGGVVPNSRQVTFNSTGDFGFQATYSGDANNNPMTSLCEPVTVSTNVSIRTTLSAATIIVGGSATDSATLAGQSATASGTVTYSDFANGVCAGPITTVSVVNVVNGIIPDSRAVTFNSTGSFSFEAVYSGDASDNSAISLCEPLTIEKATPHITSTVTPPAITVGSSATDLAAVSGFTPTGTITYTAYSDSSCTTTVFTSASIPLGTSSGAFTPTAAGTYYWVASYSGDSNNNAVATTCGAIGETLTVNGVAFDYSLSVSPVSASIIAGSSKSTTITATLARGTAQPVTLLLVISPNPAVCQVTSGPSPCGTISFSPTSITPSSNGATSTLTVSTTGMVPPGTYILTITGSPAGSSHSSATFTLTISAPSVSTVSCGHDLSCSVQSNSTLTKVKFAGITIHAEADGPKGTHGYANITVPKTAIHNIDNLHVFVDNSKLARSDVTVTSNSTDYFIYFTFTFHSPVQIDIQLTAPENAPSLILGLNPELFYEIAGALVSVFVVIVAVAVIATRRRSRASNIPRQR